MILFRKAAIVATLIYCNTAIADDPVIEDGWQFNKNVTISRLFIRPASVVAQASNGSHCWIDADDRGLLSILIATRAQKAKIDLVCEQEITGREGSQNTRRLGLVVY